MVDPGGNGLGSTYSVSGDYVVNNVPYGTTTLVDNGGAGFAATNGPVFLTITDNGPNGCSRDFEVHAPRNCYTNYLCADAMSLPGPGIYSAIGPSDGNGASQGSATHANWFSFTAPVDGKLSINSCEMGVDTRLYVHSGTCGNLSIVASSDDICSMGPGLNAWASSVDTLPMTAGMTYLIEWDNRWSGSGFDFEVLFDTPLNIEECPDVIIADVTNMGETTFRVSQSVYLEGVAEAPIEVKTQNAVDVQSDFEIASGIQVDVLRDSCAVDNVVDWQVLGGTGTQILDNSTVEILLEVPADVNFTIGDIDLELDITHTWIGDLGIDLIAPDNSMINIWDTYCGNEDNLHFILDEEVSVSSVCGDAWRSGGRINAFGVIPSSTLTAYNGVSSAGTWKLRIRDNAGGDTGVVNKVALYFREEE